MVKYKKTKKAEDEDDDYDIEEWRQCESDAYQVVIDAIEKAMEIIEDAEKEGFYTLDDYYHEIDPTGRNGYLAGFLKDFDFEYYEPMMDAMRSAIKGYKQTQQEYMNGEWD